MNKANRTINPNKLAKLVRKLAEVASRSYDANYQPPYDRPLLEAYRLQSEALAEAAYKCEAASRKL